MQNKPLTDQFDTDKAFQIAKRNLSNNFKDRRKNKHIAESAEVIELASFLHIQWVIAMKLYQLKIRKKKGFVIFTLRSERSRTETWAPFLCVAMETLFIRAAVLIGVHKHSYHKTSFF